MVPQICAEKCRATSFCRLICPHADAQGLMRSLRRRDAQTAALDLHASTAPLRLIVRTHTKRGDLCDPIALMGVPGWRC